MSIAKTRPGPSLPACTPLRPAHESEGPRAATITDAKRPVTAPNALAQSSESRHLEPGPVPGGAVARHVRQRGAHAGGGVGGDPVVLQPHRPQPSQPRRLRRRRQPSLAPQIHTHIRVFRRQSESALAVSCSVAALQLRHAADTRGNYGGDGLGGGSERLGAAAAAH